MNKSSAVKSVRFSGSVIFAVDPGASGAIVCSTGQKISAMTMDRGKHDLRQFIALNGLIPGTSAVAFMEEVGGFIGKEQPGSHMFNFGHAAGMMEGLLCGLDIPLTLVRPQKWQGAVAPGVRGMEYEERKRALKALAQHWYPDFTITLKNADAFCILRYALQGGGQQQAAVDTQERSRSQWPKDLRAFKKWCKKQGLAVPIGSELMQAVNWWVEQGRPEQ